MFDYPCSGNDRNEIFLTSVVWPLCSQAGVDEDVALDCWHCFSNTQQRAESQPWQSGI